MNIRGCMRRIKHFSTTSIGHQASFKQAKGRTKERKKTFTSHTQCRDSRINLCRYVSSRKNRKKLLPMPRAFDRESTQRRGPVMHRRKSCFFGPYFHYCLCSVHYCENHSHIYPYYP